LLLASHSLDKVTVGKSFTAIDAKINAEGSAMTLELSELHH